ncbi:MAG: single-stranded DNA binding protein [Haloferacaceae archaeon]
MGVIADVYEDLDTDVDFEEFEAAVEEKVEQMGGLADEETAAMLIAHELKDEEVNGVADIEPGMDEVKFLGKVVSIGELRTFERDGEDADGRVVNLEVADETGRIRVSLWDEMAVSAVGDPDAERAGELAEGDVLRIAGRPKEGYNGVEVSVDKAEVDDAEIDVDVDGFDVHRVEDLSLGLSDVTLQGRILEVGSVRTFDRDDGTEGRVSNLTVGDPTGRIRVTMWDERADAVAALDAGQSAEIVDGYVRERDGRLELHVGSRGAIEPIEESVEYVPETTDIGTLEIGQTVDVAGGVIEADPKRTFDRDDGTEGQVRNVRLRDETGDIRVALWGEKADSDLELADYVLVTDAEIKDGWQDDLEASAGWRSTVSVLEDAEAADGTAVADDADSSPSSGGEAGAGTADDGTPAGGLSAFAGEDASASTDADPDAPAAGSEAATAGSDADASAGRSSGSAATQTAAGAVEFTGTVVQAGSPVILDDGTETRRVETDEAVRLGEELTVRGVETDGTIEADELF